MKAQPLLTYEAEADRHGTLAMKKLFGHLSPSTLAIEQEIATLQSRLAQRRDTENMQSSSQSLPIYDQGLRLSSNEPQPKLDDDDTKRRQAFYNAAERFSARSDQNEQDELPVVTPGKSRSRRRDSC